MNRSIFLIIFFGFKAFSTETNTLTGEQKNLLEKDFNLLDKSYIDKPGSLIDIKEATSIKSQDGLGFCYAFAATSLLEHYRCVEMKLDCSDPREALSSLDVSSYSNQNEKNISEYGQSNEILENIQNSSLVLSREECIPFSSIVYEMKEEKKRTNEYAWSYVRDRWSVRSEDQGWHFLLDLWENDKSSKRDLSIPMCIENIKKTLPMLPTSLSQLTLALQNSKNFNSFMYKALIPDECIDKDRTAKIPEFKTHSYPDTVINNYSYKMLYDQIDSLLSMRTPVAVNLGGHVVSLFGIKEVCNQTQDCRKMVKVRNSYGKTWQDQNNDGWVDLQSLTEKSIGLPGEGKQDKNNITWISKE